MEIQTIETEHLGKVQIKELTIGEMLEVNKLPEDERMFYLLEKCTVKPNLTKEKVKDFPASYLDDLMKITDAAISDA